MALGDVLAARANAARATARIACGSLGEVTLEALPVRELEQLSRGGDAERAIFYAACRDLQRAGAELMRQGRLYRPDQVTALVSGEEASIAAQTVRELSGFAPEAGQDSGESADMRLRAQETPAAAAQPGVEPKGMLSFPEKKASLWTPERKGSGADLKDGAVDDRGAGVRDDTFSEADRWRYSEGERSASKENEAATPSAGAGAAVDGSGAGVRDDTFSEADRWRYSEGERSASKENEAATPSAGAGAAVDEGDAGVRDETFSEGDRWRYSEGERSASKENEAAAPTAGADAAVDEDDAGVRDDTFSEGDRWRYSEGERSASKENEAAAVTAGAVAAVNGSGAGVRDETFSEGDRWRYSEGEREFPEEDEAAAVTDGSAEGGEDAESSFSEVGRISRKDEVESSSERKDNARMPAKEGGQVSHESDLPEVRPEVVQEDAEVRHDTVQQDLTENTEIRHSFVQDGGEEVGDGQVSREFLTEEQDEIAKPDGKQVLWSETAQTPQNVVKMDKTDGGLRNNEPLTEEKQNARKRKKPNRAHESKSEIEAARSGVLHENKSELTPGDVRLMHEITSEIAEAMHENKSEFRENVHESKSEKAEILHEDKSELAERVARELLEGLRRAAWVR